MEDAGRQCWTSTALRHTVPHWPAEWQQAAASDSASGASLHALYPSAPHAPAAAPAARGGSCAAGSRSCAAAGAAPRSPPAAGQGSTQEGTKGSQQHGTAPQVRPAARDRPPGSDRTTSRPAKLMQNRHPGRPLTACILPCGRPQAHLQVPQLRSECRLARRLCLHSRQALVLSQQLLQCAQREPCRHGASTQVSIQRGTAAGAQRSAGGRR